MAGDSRIVQGGELNVEGLENVVNTVATSPTASTSAPNQVLPNVDFGTYTLNERLLQFLQNSVGSDILPRTYQYQDKGLTYNNLLDTPSIQALAQSLGADFFTLDGFKFSKTGDNTLYLVADLKMTPSIPKSSFQKGLATLLGGGETVKYLLSTDIGQALGLDDPTKPVDLNDNQIQQVFPDIAQIKNLNGTYVVPKDPYLFLLAVNPQYRRFLSACLNEGEKSRDGILGVLVTNPYSIRQIECYGLDNWLFNQVQNSNFLGLPTIIKTGQKYGLRELKPYFDSVTSLMNKLKNVSRP